MTRDEYLYGALGGKRPVAVGTDRNLGPLLGDTSNVLTQEGCAFLFVVVGVAVWH